MSESTSVKLADGLKDRLRAIAEDDGRSVNGVINEALAQYADHKEKRRAVLEDLRAAHLEYQQTGLHLTQEEVERWMARRTSGERVPMPKLHT